LLRLKVNSRLVKAAKFYS